MLPYTAVKTVRILLLVLLAALLPVRGVLAGAAHCAGSPGEQVPVVAAMGEALGPAHDGAEGTTDAAAHAAHHGHSPAAGDLNAGSDDACGLCTASCSATPCLGEPPVAVSSMPPAAVPFPALLAPPPSHPSEGPERPPRNA